MRGATVSFIAIILLQDYKEMWQHVSPNKWTSVDNESRDALAWTNAVTLMSEARLKCYPKYSGVKCSKASIPRSATAGHHLGSCVIGKANVRARKPLLRCQSRRAAPQ